MIFKKLHLGTTAYSCDTFDEISHHLSSHYTSQKIRPNLNMGGGTSIKIRKNAITRIVEAVKALALCHNVTPGEVLF